MQYQIENYLESIGNGTEPAVTGEDGRRTVELFTSIYRSSRDNMPIKFPLKP
jgi:predicted dehydrogenase